MARGGATTAKVAPAGADGDDASETVRVVVRVRPLNERERRAKASCAVSVGEPLKEGRQEVRLRVPPSSADPKRFTFDRVLGERAGQSEVFEEAARRICDRFAEGCHGCILAYGQTGSGKTFTMMGPDGGAEEGIMQRVARRVLDAADRERAKGNSATVTCQFLEIYQEHVTDLLADARAASPEPAADSRPATPTTPTTPTTTTTAAAASGHLQIREQKGGGVYVSGASSAGVESLDEFAALMARGNGLRQVGATNMNARSSRSHAVLTLRLVQRAADDADGLFETDARLHLVDLAGSERQESTGATGQRLREGAKINLSLSALGNVINALATGGRHVPYRDSKLTRLLSGSLGGNCVTSLVACVSPADSGAAETLSTLRFANRAKQIQNRAVVSMDPKARKIKELRAEVARLRRMLEACPGCGAGRDTACAACGSAIVADAAGGGGGDGERRHGKKKPGRRFCAIM